MSGFGRPNGNRGSSSSLVLSILFDVEGGIGHDEVELFDRVVEVLVVGIAFPDVAAEAVNSEVHVGEPDGVTGLLLAVDRQLLARVAAVTLDEVGRLHEHAAGAARGVVDLAVEGFEDLHDEPHDRGGSEELAALLALGECELAEEVLVDEPEPVALDRPRQRPQEPQQLSEDAVGDAGNSPSAACPGDRGCDTSMPPMAWFRALPMSASSGRSSSVSNRDCSGRYNAPAAW